MAIKMNDDMNFNPVTQDIIGYDAEFPASMAPISFLSSGSKILGTMFIAQGKGPNPTVLLLSGFPGNELNYDIAHMLRRQGFNVMTFFYRGSWGSQGNYTWNNILEDCSAAIEFLKTQETLEKFRIDKDRISLVGYSMGGFNALYNACRFNEIKNVVSIAGSNAGAFAEIISQNKTIYDYAFATMLPSLEYVKCESPKILLDEMIENKKEWNLVNKAASLASKNVLLIGAKYDSLVPLDFNHNAMVNALQQVNANFTHTILETGHSFSDKRIELMTVISKWFYKILE